MVRRDLAGRGISDRRVLDAMGAVPRELFVPQHLAADAYADTPLPIGNGQTISQPYMVAAMIEALRLAGGEKVLEIGAGSGYAAAVLARIADRVYAIERIDALAELARTNLARAGIGNVEIRHGDGSLGWPEQAPFDAILVSAGAPAVPEPLTGQLARAGRLVVPVGDAPNAQQLLRVTRTAAGLRRESLGAVRFVPLIGALGWGDEHDGPDHDAGA